MTVMVNADGACSFEFTLREARRILIYIHHANGGSGAWLGRKLGHKWGHKWGQVSHFNKMLGIPADSPFEYENDHFFNALNPADGAADTDRDGISNRDETHHGTDPRAADTDLDGMVDAWENEWGCHKSPRALVPVDSCPFAPGQNHCRRAQEVT